jgi:hypothetical protein
MVPLGYLSRDKKLFIEEEDRSRGLRLSLNQGGRYVIGGLSFSSSEA